MSARTASRSNSAKAFLALSLSVGLALTCGACGRRGALEPPTGATADRGGGATTAPASPRTLPGGISTGSGSLPADPDAVRSGDELAASATPAGTDSAAPVQTNRGAKRGYRIPKEPFILDPIL